VADEEEKKKKKERLSNKMELWLILKFEQETNKKYKGGKIKMHTDLCSYEKWET
jgi:hypothetical protein